MFARPSSRMPVASITASSVKSKPTAPCRGGRRPARRAPRSGASRAHRSAARGWRGSSVGGAGAVLRDDLAKRLADVPAPVSEQRRLGGVGFVMQGVAAPEIHRRVWQQRVLLVANRRHFAADGAEGGPEEIPE